MNANQRELLKSFWWGLSRCDKRSSQREEHYHRATGVGPQLQGMHRVYAKHADLSRRSLGEGVSHGAVAGGLALFEVALSAIVAALCPTRVFSIHAPFDVD
jgi:hypothetical protein